MPNSLTHNSDSHSFYDPFFFNNNLETNGKEQGIKFTYL